jgi:hypothetical protein
MNLKMRKRNARICSRLYPNHTQIKPGKKLFKTDPDEDDKGDCGTQVRYDLEEPDFSRAATKESYDKGV